MFEPRYYERAAQRHIVGQLRVPLFINVPWGLDGSLPTRAEIDGVFLQERHAVPVEVKAHLLDARDLEAIVSKYRRLGFCQLMIVAPGLTTGTPPPTHVSGGPQVEFVVYRPTLEEIRDWYEAEWLAAVPEWVSETLATGRHHIRFVLTRPTKRGTFVVGQQRSRVYDPATVLRLLRVLPWPPARVLWTPQRFTVPRDLIARGSRVTPLGGFVPVDIDGDVAHRARHACELDPSTVACAPCEWYAEAELERLEALVAPAPIAVVASGGRGLHAYYLDTAGVRAEILAAGRTGAVRIDENVTASLKATVAIPGSLHAGWMRRVGPRVQADSSQRLLRAAAC